MSIEANNALVRGVLEALFQRDFTRFDQHPGLLEIKQTVTQVVEMPRGNLPTTSIELLVAEGDWVASRSVFRGGRLARPVLKRSHSTRSPTAKSSSNTRRVGRWV